tara:strand:+ start:528 stop:785 length:258 start_codon:yes stop_codon:yes gene_type:complete
MSNINDFRSAIDEEYDFPAEYSFKFIIKAESKLKILSLLPKSKVTERLSKNGTYVSVTLTQKMNNSEEIVYIYEKASKIKGVISL